MKLSFCVVFCVVSLLFAQDHILVTEVCVRPTDGEFVEIYNPLAGSVDLTDYYLTDLYEYGGAIESWYPYIVAGPIDPYSSDFCVQFPSGTSIAAGGIFTIAMNGVDFETEYGFAPDFDIQASGTGTAMAVPPNGFAGASAGISNSGEVIMLFYWDGATDLVQDVDYALWGDALDRRIDKTGIALDGPDGDTEPSTYFDDTAPDIQDPISDGAHPDGQSFQRDDMTEGTETQTGGNGITGNDETSENLSVTWFIADASPGVVFVGLQPATWAEIKTLLVIDSRQLPPVISF